MKINSFFTAFSIFFVVVMMCSTNNALAQGERRLIREGNKLYHKQQFNESELSYRRALEKDDDSPQARFNLGNSLYKQERYDEATGFFSELAGEVEDPLNKSMVYHNMGNSLLMSQQLNESIEAYKEALRNNPADSETRYNLALAQKLLDEQQQQQDDQQDDQQDEQDEDQQDEDQQEDEDQEDEQDESEEEDESEEDEEDDSEEEDESAEDEEDESDEDENQQDESEEDEQQDEGQQDQQEEQDQNQSSQSQQQQQQISPEDALRMLEAAGREEQQVQEKVMENKASEKQPATGRNW